MLLMSEAIQTEYLTVAEAAAVLRTSPASVHFIIAHGKLRSFRPGRLRLIRRDDLDAYIAAAEKPAVRFGHLAPNEHEIGVRTECADAETQPLRASSQGVARGPR